MRGTPRKQRKVLRDRLAPLHKQTLRVWAKHETTDGEKEIELQQSVDLITDYWLIKEHRTPRARSRTRTRKRTRSRCTRNTKRNASVVLVHHMTIAQMQCRPLDEYTFEWWRIRRVCAVQVEGTRYKWPAERRASLATETDRARSAGAGGVGRGRSWSECRWRVRVLANRRRRRAQSGRAQAVALSAPQGAAKLLRRGIALATLLVRFRLRLRTTLLEPARSRQLRHRRLQVQRTAAVQSRCSHRLRFVARTGFALAAWWAPLSWWSGFYCREEFCKGKEKLLIRSVFVQFNKSL